MARFLLIFHSSCRKTLYCFRRWPSFHSVTEFPERKGRKALWLMSPRKFCESRAGMPRTSLMVPSRRVLSVELIPPDVEVPKAGVSKPLGGRTEALNVSDGVTLMPPG